MSTNLDRAKVGDVITIPRGGNLAAYATVIRRRGDAYDGRRCAHCGEAFSYGAIARDCITNELICGFPCEAAR